MSEPANSLWPPEIRTGVRSPFSLLREQADLLTNLTGGLLVGRVSRLTTSGKVRLRMYISVPLLRGFRANLLTVTHARDRVYPALIDAECFRDSSPLANLGRQGRTRNSPPEPGRLAHNDTEFTGRLAEVLRSEHVVSLAQSLIAQANDKSLNESPGVDDELSDEVADAEPSDEDSLAETPDPGAE